METRTGAGMSDGGWARGGSGGAEKRSALRHFAKCSRGNPHGQPPLNYRFAFAGAAFAGADFAAGRPRAAGGGSYPVTSGSDRMRAVASARRG